MKKILMRSIGALAIAVLSTSTARAQVVVGAGATFETYSFADPAAAAGLKSVRLMTLPFAGTARLADWLRLTVNGAYASAESEHEGGSGFSIDGLTDTSIQIAVPLGQDRVTLAAALILPTGKTTYTIEEATVAGIIAADLFPFAISNWGSGGAVDVSTSAAVPLGGINVGARVGFQMAREFDLLEGGSFAYRPGNQLYGRVAADASMGAGRFAGEVTIYHFGEDQFQSQNLYQSGNRVQGMLSYSFPLGRQGSAAMYGGVLHREHGTFLDNSAPNTPAQTLLLFGAGARRPIGFGTLLPAIDVRLLSREDGLSQGYIVGAGTAIEIPLSGNLTFVPTAKLRIGNLQASAGNETSITGFEVGAVMRFGSLRP